MDSEKFNSRKNSRHLIKIYEQAQKLLTAWDGIHTMPTFVQLIKAAPEFQHDAIEWLIKLAGRGLLKAADIYHADETLELFEHAKKHGLLKNKKSRILRSYASLMEVNAALQPLRTQRLTLPWQDADPEKIAGIERAFFMRGEAVLLADTEKYRVIMPLTAKAAQFFERDSKWCTGYTDKPNVFHRYALMGPIIDVFMKNSREKFALHFGFNEYVDRINAPIDLHNLFVRLPGLFDVVKPFLFGHVFNQSYLLNLVPVKDEQFWIDMVSSNDETLCCVPDAKRSRNVFIAALRRNGNRLGIVPWRDRDAELCDIAVESQGTALEHVPPRKKSYALCLKAGRLGGDLVRVPPEHRDYVMCFEFVANRGLNLADVPQGLIDQKICDAAVSRDPLAIEFVPVRYQTLSLCIRAVTQLPEFELDRLLVADKLSTALEFAITHHRKALEDRNALKGGIKEDVLEPLPEFKELIEWRQKFYDEANSTESKPPRSPLRNQGMPSLPPAKADEIAQLAGFRVDIATGIAYLAPADRRCFSDRPAVKKAADISALRPDAKASQGTALVVVPVVG